MKSFYLLINFFSVIDSYLFPFHQKLNFHKQWKHFFIAMIIASLLFLSNVTFIYLQKSIFSN